MSGIIGDNTGDHSGQIATVQGVTTSSSDPAIDTNPSGGIGTVWANTTSGEMYACTDATAGANVWTNVGDGAGAIEPYVFQGTNYGYNYGGYNGNNTVHKVSYSSDGNASDVADMTLMRDAWSGSSSATQGFASGGYVSGVTRNIIDAFTFATEADMTDHGDLIQNKRRFMSGHSSADYSYTSGAYLVGGEGGSGTAGYNEITRFATASTSDAADVGDLSKTVQSASGASDVGNSYGFTAGGWRSGSKLNEIDRFAYASSASGSDWEDIYEAQGEAAGSCSTTHGYVLGGGEASISDTMQKYPFASQTTGTDVGNLIRSNFECTGTASTTHVFVHGGMNPHGGSPIDDIQKRAFASDGDAGDVGNLSTNNGYMGDTGSQY